MRVTSYGIGVLVGLIPFNRQEVASGEITEGAMFLVSMVGSAMLGHAVSVGLEGLFGAVWWDYSNMPFYLNGRKCLLVSLSFGMDEGLAEVNGVFGDAAQRLTGPSPAPTVVNALQPRLHARYARG